MSDRLKQLLHDIKCDPYLAKDYRDTFTTKQGKRVFIHLMSSLSGVSVDMTTPEDMAFNKVANTLTRAVLGNDIEALQGAWLDILKAAEKREIKLTATDEKAAPLGRLEQYRSNTEGDKNG